MAGTLAGGAKARDTNLKRDPLFYKKIGSKGGSSPTASPKGFAAMTREKRSEAGKKGGTISRRTYPKKVQDETNE